MSEKDSAFFFFLEGEKRFCMLGSEWTKRGKFKWSSTYYGDHTKLEHVYSSGARYNLINDYEQN